MASRMTRTATANPTTGFEQACKIGRTSTSGVRRRWLSKPKDKMPSQAGFRGLRSRTQISVFEKNPRQAMRTLGTYFEDTQDALAIDSAVSNMSTFVGFSLEQSADIEWNPLNGQFVTNRWRPTRRPVAGDARRLGRSARIATLLPVR